MTMLVDLHCHMLGGTDDGAENDEVAAAMLDAAYADGVRVLCLTPHYNSRVWPDVPERADAAYERLSRLAAERYPDLTLCRGNELFYQHDAVGDIAKGRCRTLNGGRYVLVDFAFETDFFNILTGLNRLAAHGYKPLLAHTERYACLWGKPERLARLEEEAHAAFQINASSLFGGWGKAVMRQARRIVRRRQAFVIASDAHDLTDRPPGLSTAWEWVAKKCGRSYADLLCRDNPLAVLGIGANP